MYRAIAIAFDPAKNRIHDAEESHLSEDSAMFGAMQRLRAKFPVGEEHAWDSVEIQIQRIR